MGVRREKGLCLDFRGIKTNELQFRERIIRLGYVLLLGSVIVFVVVVVVG